MQIIDTPDLMRAWSVQQRSEGKRIGFVPTMGALHAGHSRLMDVSREQCDVTVLSIFVNKAQFNVEADFLKYPRTFEEDVAIAKSRGVDVVYAPSSAVMYPVGFNSFVEPGHCAEPMEGAGRPGHFKGVTTVVLKLLHAVEPHVAFFGKKDFQQLAVIKQMVLELDMGVIIQGIDTVRESDGLALSSRNVRLTSEHRSQAPVIFESLQLAESAVRDGELNANRLEQLVTSHIHTQKDARVEYVQVVDAVSLQRLDSIAKKSVICVACWFGEVRLIDNLELTVP